MGLEIHLHRVDEVVLGDRHGLDAGRLHLNAAKLRDLVLADPLFSAVVFEVVRPGERARITDVTDVIQPDADASSWLDPPPGWEPPPRSDRLAGVTVVTAGEVPYLGGTGLLVPRDAIIDTFGPGGELSPFAEEHHLVLDLEYAAGGTYEDYEAATAAAGLRVAGELAGLAAGLPAAHVTTVESGRIGDLPVVLYACQVHSQSALLRTRYRGEPADELMPTLISAAELVGGGVTTGGLGAQSSKITTWAHQNNPVVADLVAGHGTRWAFGGVILHRGHYYLFEEKQQVADEITRLALEAGAAGVIFTLGGVGNNLIEVMLAIERCERAGIATVLLAWEQGGPDGDQYPLSYAVPEAVAVVSTGSLDQPIDLPAADRVVGPPEIRLNAEDPDSGLAAASPLRLPRRGLLVGAINPLGQLPIGCLEY